MAAISQLDINLEGIAHALADKQLIVPVYQRPYAWEEENVRDLLLDISNSIKEKANEYFLGSIVLTEGADGKLEVVDGQQRLATISIVVAGIRDYMLRQLDSQRANQIESKYLQKVDLKSLEAAPQLKMNVYDNAFYKSRILSRPDDAQRAIKSSKESHRRLEKAAKAVEVFLNQLANTTKTPVPDLIDWLDYLEKKVKIIVVRVPDDRHAWIIFETLNDRGLALSISDLLKNYLFGMAEEHLPEVQNYWGEMQGAIETAGDEDVVLMYLRQVWASFYGLTREKELFDQVKRKITSKQGAVDFARELAANAKTYAAILNAQNEFWQPYGDTARAQVDVLLTLGLKQPRPLLLALIAKFNPQETKKALVYLVSCSVRFMIVGQLGSSTLENLYADTGKLVRQEKIKTAKELAEHLAKQVPNDREFESAFTVARLSSAVHARYYLRALELTASGKKEPEFVPNSNRDVINLEHILPQSPVSAQWPGFDDEQAQALCNRIGNLALLRLKKNSEIGNAAFDKKVGVYKQSEFILTQKIAESPAWTPDSIQKRQEELASLALKTWTIQIAN
jgi:hypothetical protein